MGKAECAEWWLTNVIVMTQFANGIYYVVTKAINDRSMDDVANNTESIIVCLLIALSFVALMGANSGRRILIVFTCFFLYFVAIYELQLTIMVFHKHYTGQPVACSRKEMIKSADGCFAWNAAMILLFLFKSMATLTASFLCTIRLLAPSAPGKEVSHQQTILVRHTNQSTNNTLN